MLRSPLLRDYGQTGPKATLPGYASVCEAYGGFRCLLIAPAHIKKLPHLQVPVEVYWQSTRKWP